jgi:hypothetical protein
MSAEDNLSPRQFKLYHGTDAYIDESKRIEPTLQGPDNREDLVGQKVAFATTSQEEAHNYGKNVYEVHPDEHTEKFNDLGVFINKKGFNIKKRVESRDRTYNDVRQLDKP